MRTGKAGLLVLGVLCAASMSACGMLEQEKWEPAGTALDMKEDGTLTETVKDVLDQSYYNASELENMINSSVSEYDQAHGGSAVTVDELTCENNQVVLTMTYASPDDYAGYNNVKFYNGSMLGAEMAGFLFYNQFIKVDDGSMGQELLSNEEPLKHKEYQVLVTDLSHEVHVPGDIVYISSNGQITGKRSAKPKQDAVTVQEDNLVLLEGAEAQDDHSPVTAKDLEKNYLYVIYEY